MEWTDEGVALGARAHGETSAILEVFTAAHGRRRGLVRGGASPKRAADLQPGAQLSVRWRGRLAEHLGQFAVEPIRTRAGRLLDDPAALAGLRSATALLSAFLPEGEPAPAFYDGTIALFDLFDAPEAWPSAYAHWELALLSALGFGLDLSECAATGSTQELIWVSPKSGRAVSRAAGAPYADRLLPLPAFLRLGGPSDPADFARALSLTGHFLAAWAAPACDIASPPAARARLIDVARRLSQEV